MEDNKSDHPAGDVDPAEAFEALRQTVTELQGAIEARNRHLDAELAIIRKSIESALKQLAAVQQPVDYSADMTRTVELLDNLARRLKAIGESPVLQLGPHESARIMTDAGDGQIRPAIRQLETGTRSIMDKTRAIGRHLRPARTHIVYFMNKWEICEAQDFYIGTTILVFTAVGFISAPFWILFLYRYFWFPISQWLN